MSIIIMNNIIFATAFLVATAVVGFGADYDLEKITTTEGKEYREILVIESDEHGLTFRHRHGISKLLFSSLPTNLRMLYEGTVPLEAPEEVADTEEAVVADSGGPELDSLVFTVRTRVYPPMNRGGYGVNGCSPVGWPSAWPRYNPALLLANPYCREWATRDFLYTSGLLRKPPGVFTYRLPYHRPYFY